MNKILKNLRASVLIILGGLVCPAILSIIFSGFKIHVVTIVSFQFFVGVIIALLGGILIAFDYSQFRKKIMKTPMDLEVKSEDDNDKIDWPNVFFYSGIIILLAAFAIGEIF